MGVEVAVPVAGGVTVIVGELVPVEVGEKVEVAAGGVAVPVRVKVGVGEGVEVADEEAAAVPVWVAVCDDVELAEGVEVGVLVMEGVVVPVTGSGVSVGAGALLLEGVVGLLLPGQPVRRAENKRRGSSNKAPRKGMAGEWDRLEPCFILKPSGCWVE